LSGRHKNWKVSARFIKKIRSVGFHENLLSCLRVVTGEQTSLAKSLKRNIRETRQTGGSVLSRGNDVILKDVAVVT